MFGLERRFKEADNERGEFERNNLEIETRYNNLKI
jgi:hypothetical protein